jgi:hypothetical protein
MPVWRKCPAARVVAVQSRVFVVGMQLAARGSPTSTVTLCTCCAPTLAGSNHTRVIPSLRSLETCLRRSRSCRRASSHFSSSVTVSHSMRMPYCSASITETLFGCQFELASGPAWGTANFGSVLQLRAADRLWLGRLRSCVQYGVLSAFFV